MSFGNHDGVIECEVCQHNFCIYCHNGSCADCGGDVCDECAKECTIEKGCGEQICTECEKAHDCTPDPEEEEADEDAE